MDRSARPMDGTKIRSALSMMNERGSGEGAGYAVYGAFPEFADYYAIHVFFDAVHESKTAVDLELEKWGTVVHEEEVPTYENSRIRRVHTPWRYFFRPDPSLMPRSMTPEDDIVMHLAMKINTTIPGALVYASGKMSEYSKHPDGQRMSRISTGSRTTVGIPGLPITATRQIPRDGGEVHTHSTSLVGVSSIMAR